MSPVHWGAPWTWFCVAVLMLCQGLLKAQIEQYHQVSQDAFVDIVTYMCESYRTSADTVTQCALFCPIPGGRYCFAFALGSASCWICGEDMVGDTAASDILNGNTFWVNSGKSRRQRKWFKSEHIFAIEHAML